MPTVLLTQPHILRVFKAGLSGGSFSMLGAPGSSLSVRTETAAVSLRLWVADPKNHICAPPAHLLAPLHLSSSVQEIDSCSVSTVLVLPWRRRVQGLPTPLSWSPTKQSCNFFILTESKWDTSFSPAYYWAHLENS